MSSPDIPIVDITCSQDDDVQSTQNHDKLQAKESPSETLKRKAPPLIDIVECNTLKSSSSSSKKVKIDASSSKSSTCKSAVKTVHWEALLKRIEKLEGTVRNNNNSILRHHENHYVTREEFTTVKERLDKLEKRVENVEKFLYKLKKVFLEEDEVNTKVSQHNSENVIQGAARRREDGPTVVNGVNRHTETTKMVSQSSSRVNNQDSAQSQRKSLDSTDNQDAIANDARRKTVSKVLPNKTVSPINTRTVVTVPPATSKPNEGRNSTNQSIHDVASRQLSNTGSTSQTPRANSTNITNKQPVLNSSQKAVTSSTVAPILSASSTGTGPALSQTPRASTVNKQPVLNNSQKASTSVTAILSASSSGQLHHNSRESMTAQPSTSTSQTNQVPAIPIKQELFERLHDSIHLTPSIMDTPLRKDNDDRVLVYISGMAKKIRNVDKYVAVYSWDIDSSNRIAQVYYSDMKTVLVKKQAEILAAIFALDHLKNVSEAYNTGVTIVANCKNIVEVMNKVVSVYPLQKDCKCKTFPCTSGVNHWYTTNTFASHFPDDLPRLFNSVGDLNVKWILATDADDKNEMEQLNSLLSKTLQNVSKGHDISFQ